MVGLFIDLWSPRLVPKAFPFDDGMFIDSHHDINESTYHEELKKWCFKILLLRLKDFMKFFSLKNFVPHNHHYSLVKYFF